MGRRPAVSLSWCRGRRTRTATALNGEHGKCPGICRATESPDWSSKVRQRSVTGAKASSSQGPGPRFESTIALALRWGRELHKYAAVGGVVLLLDVGLYWLLINLCAVWYLYAHFVSRAVGGLACFALNRQVTFRSHAKGRFVQQLVRFVLLYALSFILSSFLIYGLVGGLASPRVLGKVAAELIVFLMNYSIMKYWVLKTEPEGQ